MHLVACVVDGLDNASRASGVADAWREAWAGATALGLPNAQSHPHVRALRTHFQAAGVSMKEGVLESPMASNSPPPADLKTS